MIYKKIFLIFLISLLFSTFVFSTSVSNNSSLNNIVLYSTPSPILVKSNISKNHPIDISAKPISIDINQDINFPITISSGDISLPPGVIDIKKYFSHVTPRVNSNLKKLLRSSSRELITSTVPNTWGTMPLSGDVHIPVLLVDFTDRPHTIDSNIFDDYFNSDNYLDGNAISVNKYFYHESYGDLNVTFDIYGWKLLTAHTYAWYAQNNFNTFQMVLDTIAAFDPEVDFSQYDADGDGRIDGFEIIHAGIAKQEGSGNIADSARIFSGSTNYSVDGLLYGNVAIVSEMMGVTLCNSAKVTFSHPSDCRKSIVVSTHELCHVLGLPDLYEISPDGYQVGPGLGDMTMMVQTQHSDPDFPINLDSWSRFFLGWLPAIKVGPQAAGDFIINSVDDHRDLYYLQDNNRMDSREFFLVANRYKSVDTQDKWLLNVGAPETNSNGGLEVYHVDENYIEYNYNNINFNNIMYDSDGDFYDDNISHPGIVNEKKFLTVTNYLGLDILYTNEVGTICIPDIYTGIFDSNKRVDPNCGVTNDTTSHSYINNFTNTEVKLEAQSPSGPVIQTFLQSRIPFTAEILSPENNSGFDYTDPIIFEEDHNNPTGIVSCIWYSDYNSSTPILLSNDCNFTSTSYNLGLSNGDHIITLIETDQEGREVSDNVSIKTGFYADILSPLPKSEKSYSYAEPMDLNATLHNNTGTVTCSWSDENGVILSTNCTGDSIIPKDYWGLSGFLSNKSSLVYSTPILSLNVFSNFSLEEDNHFNVLFTNPVIISTPVSPLRSTQIITHINMSGYDKNIIFSSFDSGTGDSYTKTYTIHIGLFRSLNNNHNYIVD